MSEIFFAGIDQWSQLEAMRDLPERTFAAHLLWRVLLRDDEGHFQGVEHLSLVWLETTLACSR